MASMFGACSLTRRSRALGARTSAGAVALLPLVQKLSFRGIKAASEVLGIRCVIPCALGSKLGQHEMVTEQVPLPFTTPEVIRTCFLRS